MVKVRTIFDFTGGCLAGTLMVWSLTALTSSHAAFGPSWYPDDFEPVRGILSFKSRIIDHEPSWICLIALMFVTVAAILFAFWACRPINKYRFFVAGLTGSTISVLVFVWHASKASFVGVPGRVWIPAAQYGSSTWLALQHHQNAFWTLEDEFAALKMLDIAAANLCVLSLCLILPIVWAIFYEQGAKTDREDRRFAGRSLTLLLTAMVSVAAYSFSGGISGPMAEPIREHVTCYYSNSKIKKGKQIEAREIERKELLMIPDLRKHCETLSSNPTGKITRFEIMPGQVISIHDVEDAEPAVKALKKNEILYGAWQTATKKMADGEPAKTVRAAKATRNIKEGSIIKSEDITLVSVPEGSIDGNLPEHPDIVVGATSGRIRRNQILVYTAGSSYRDYHGIPYLYLFADFLPDPVPESVR